MPPAGIVHLAGADLHRRRVRRPAVGFYPAGQRREIRFPGRDRFLPAGKGPERHRHRDEKSLSAYGQGRDGQMIRPILPGRCLPDWGGLRPRSAHCQKHCGGPSRVHQGRLQRGRFDHHRPFEIDLRPAGKAFSRRDISFLDRMRHSMLY